MGGKHIKRCSMPLIIGEIQIKIKMRYRYSFTGIDKNKIK